MSEASAQLKPGASWLPRALAISAMLHGLAWGIGAIASSGGLRTREVETVDIEVAPLAPKAETLPQERAPISAPAPAVAAVTDIKKPVDEEDGVPVPPRDAGVAAADAGLDAPLDAMPDAPPKKKKRKPKPKPDAGPDAQDAQDAQDAPDAMVAQDAPDAPDAPDARDARDGADAPDARDARDGASDATPTVATLPDGGPLTDAAPTDGALAAAADAVPRDGGVTAYNPEDGLGDTPTSAGTSSNLLAYFPKGHLVTALIRFDRLRGTRWAEPAEKLLRPMPDYRSLFGDGDPKLVERFDTLVISSPKPRDPTATTLAGRSAMTRAELRRFFDEQRTPITWTTVRGGALGMRYGDRVLPGDPRVIYSPVQGWFFLTPTTDLPGLTTPARGDVDAAVNKGKLPEWVQRVQTIEDESGKPWGPALIVTVTATRARWKIPEMGLGVTSVPAPERATLAMELVKQGWVLRGNVKLATEAEAQELATAVETVRQRVVDSTLLQAVLKRGHALNVVLGLTVKRTGTRVAFATSVSIKDAQIFLQLAADSLEQYFAAAARGQAPSLPLPLPVEEPQKP